MKPNKFILKCLMLLVMGVCAGDAYGVPVHINSGNPTYPFPQFVPYAYGTSHKLENLGTKNPEGVVHAEMEQDIRDAYQIFANEWTYTGEEFGGVKYIRGNIGCPYDCREGDGYSLLAAAIMGDKTSFDGLWMCVHDKSRVKRERYIDGEVLAANYAYGDYTIKDNTDAATDGDVDIAIALYIAWRQWGDYMGINDFNGNPISYRKEMLDVIHGFVHLQTRFPEDGEPRRYLSGEIGLDGYLKNGNTWPEITSYVTLNPQTIEGVSMIPEFKGPNNLHSDYMAPAYFDEFFNLLDELNPSEITEFEKNQFKRCAASCDWIVGNWIGQSDKNIFVGEEVTVETNVTLHAGNQGGRFRSPWRTALNYMWHGNPTYTWNPTTHTVSDGGNTFEYDASIHYSKYMSDPQGWDPSSECTKFGGPLPLTFKGPSTLQWDVQPDGSYVSSEFTFNWIPGCGMPSAVNSQDLDLLGLLYRECDIEWDVTEGNDGYLSSVPYYFHGWFRLLGMLVATGNHIAPSQMAKAKPNLKIYRSIEDSLSFAYTGDEFTYYLDYRNYGSVAAQGTKIVENVPEDFEFVSASDGGVYNAATHTVTWNIGTVPGFASDDVEGAALNPKATNLAKTMGQVSYKVRVSSEAFGRYCTTADITCTNGDGWTSNEYPNFITATMQRNCVDVIKRALKIEKKADREKVNPGNTVTYTVNFENSSEAGWLDGGRPRVNIGFANSGEATTSQQWLKFRLYNDAIEPYINYGNYRISYYMYDSNLKCVTSDDDCPVGWGWYTAVYEGKRSADDKIKVSHETIVEGSDEKGHWNQRMSLQFSPLLVTTSAHISNYYGMGARIHKGGTETLRAYGYIFPSTWSASDFGDDWSWDANAGDADDGVYFPVTPSWQEIDPTTGKSIEKVVDEYIPSACETPTHTIDNILVEEYDGYTWRRILGNGPMAGREAENVVVIDTLPKGMTFVAFQNNCPLSDYGASWDSYQIADGRWVVKWEIPLMQVKQKGSIIYTAEASFPSGNECETDDEETINIAWISADLNSPIGDTAIVTVTCAKVPDPIVPTTLTKEADKESYSVGDEITYTIGYKQTHGAIFENAGASASDWTLSGATLSDGTLNVPDKGTAKYNKSYSKDSYIELNCNLTTYASTEIVFRDKIKLDIRLDWATLKLTCYDGTELKKEASVVYQSSTPILRVLLRDNIMQVWLDNDTTNSASFIVDDLTTVTPGCLGFNGIEAGNFSYSSIYVHTDYAYDLSIVDRVPAEVTVDETSFKAYHNGTLAGTGTYYRATSASAQDSIVFTNLADNPIAFNDTFTVEWSGTVDECVESIINVAYAKLLGHADNEIMAQVVTGCGEVECELEKVTLTTENETFCETDSTVIKATATPKGTYYYQFFADGEPVGKLTKADSLIAKTAGSYVVKVFASSDTTDSDCFAKSKALELTVDTMPKTILADTSVCAGSALNLLATETTILGYNYSWSDGSTTNKITVSEEGEYIAEVTNGTCVAKDTANVKFGSATLTDGVFTLGGVDYDRATYDGAPMCPGIEGTLSVNYVADDGEYTWTSDPADPTMVSDGNTITMSPTVDTKYYVSFVQGCDAVDSFTVTIGTPMVITVEKATLCNSIKINATTEDSEAPVFHWSIDGLEQDDTEDYIVLNEDYSKGTVSVYATAADACTSDVENVTFQNNNMTALIDGTPSVCPNNSAVLSIVATSEGLEGDVTYTYAWLDESKSVIAGETTDQYTAQGGAVKNEVKTYYGVVSNGFCTDTIEHKLTIGNGEIKGTFTINDSTIYGSPKQYGFCGEELVLVADYVKTEGDFAWQIDGVDQSATGNTLTITPTADTTVVTIKWINECDAFDTIVIAKQKDVEYSILAVQSCGSTTVKMTATTPETGMHYYWSTSANTEYEGANYVASLTDYPAASGTADITVKADGYCTVVENGYAFTIDTLGVTLETDESVCSNTPVSKLIPTAVSTDAATTFTYTYAYRKAGSTTKFTDITEAELLALPLAEATEIQVTATDGICTATDVATVTIGVPVRDGALTVDGVAVAAVDENGTKTYKTCGDDQLAIAVTHTSDLNDYTWNFSVGTATAAAGTGASIAVVPETSIGTYTAQYVVTYTNGCPVTDTLNLVVMPLSAVADWTTGGFDAEHCTGTSTSAELTISGYNKSFDGAYIKWFKDGNELTAFSGKTTLTFDELALTDAGTYSYEVSNGICTAPKTADQSILVVNQSTELNAITEYYVPKGNDTTVTATVTPETAELNWYIVGEDETFTPTSTNITVDKDYKLAAVSGGTGYCSDTIYVMMYADANPVIKLSASALAICEGNRDTLIIDTTGTGKLRNPSQYKLSYFLLGSDNEYHSIEGTGTLLSLYPKLTSTYKVKATYGGIIAWSEPVTIEVYNHANYTLNYDANICSGNTANISIVNLSPADATVSWGESESLTGNGTTAVATPVETTTYSFFISQNDGACIDKGTVTINAKEQPQFDLPTDTTICAGESVKLRAKLTAGTANSYKWYEGTDTTSAVIGASSMLNAEPEASTVYTFTASNGVCDASVYTINVNISPLPEIASIEDVAIKTVQIIAQGGADGYTYAYDNNEYQADDIIKVGTYGIHTFHVMDQLGCVGSMVDTLEAPAIEIPTVITPNGDGVNDVFSNSTLAESYPEATIKIFDRYGKLLVEYKASEGGWDGTYNGHKMPSTDYWYEIQVDEIDKTYTGHFTLLNDN